MYSVRNFLFYLMWDIIITPLLPPPPPPPPPTNKDITSLLYFMGLRKQTNKHLSRDQMYKLSHQGRKSVLILFIMTHTQPCRYYPF